MAPGIAAVQDVLETLFESELGVKSNSKKFHLRIDFVSRHTVLGWVLFFWRVWTWRI